MMSEEIRITDPKTGGQKGSKPERFDLIPPNFLVQAVCGIDAPEACTPECDARMAVAELAEFARVRGKYSVECAFRNLWMALERAGIDPGAELARVYGFGSTKYAPYNWLKGYAWSLSFAACCRHVKAYLKGESFDNETDCHHLAHAMWHCVTLSTFWGRGLGTDDLFPAYIGEECEEKDFDPPTKKRAKS